MGSDLAVIVDADSRKNLSELQNRWFGEIKQNDKDYLIEPPIGGKPIEVYGTLVRNPKLSEHSAEYLYLELTNTCNFACRHCGVKGDVNHIKDSTLVDDNAPYLTEKFVDALAESLKRHPFPGLERKLFYGGGEPLISPKKFAKINNKLAQLKRTYPVVITNGCSLPLDQNDFYKFMEDIGSPYLFFTLSTEHNRQYERISKNDSLHGYMPLKSDDSEEAIRLKIWTINRYCSEKELGFSVLALNSKDGKGKKLEEDLRKQIIKEALDIEIHTIEQDEKREPCSQGMELSIRANGDLYPYCTDIFNGHPKLGVIGLLRK